MGLAMRLAAVQLGKEHADPMEWAKALSRTALAMSLAAEPLAPQHMEGLVDRAFRAACHEAAKADALSSTFMGRAQLAGAGKVAVAKAAADFGEEAGCWTFEIRAAMLETIGEGRWRNRWEREGREPEWAAPGAGIPADWPQWQREAAKRAVMAAPELARARRKAGDLARAAEQCVEAFMAEASPAFPDHVKRAARALAGMDAAGRARAEAKSMGRMARHLAGSLEQAGRHAPKGAAEFKRAAWQATVVGARALALRSPEGDDAAAAACQALVDSLKGGSGESRALRAGIIRSEIAPWLGAASSGSLAAAGLAAKLRAAAWAPGWERAWEASGGD